MRNLTVYLAVLASFTFVLGAIGFSSQEGTAIGEALIGWVFGTLWLAIAGLFVVLPYLLVVEFLVRRGPHRRLVAVALGAVMTSGGLVLSQLGHVTVDVQSTLVAITVGAIGAVFGAVVILPPAGHALDIPRR